MSMCATIPVAVHLDGDWEIQLHMMLHHDSIILFHKLDLNNTYAKGVP